MLGWIQSKQKKDYPNGRTICKLSDAIKIHKDPPNWCEVIEQLK